MKTEQLNRLLNTACVIISALEHNADSDLQKEIDAFFSEIKYSDELDEEMNNLSTLSPSQQADIEAQDWDVFGRNKI